MRKINYIGGSLLNVFISPYNDSTILSANFIHQYHCGIIIEWPNYCYKLNFNYMLYNICVCDSHALISIPDTL